MFSSRTSGRAAAAPWYCLLLTLWLCSCGGSSTVSFSPGQGTSIVRQQDVNDPERNVEFDPVFGRTHSGDILMFRKVPENRNVVEHYLPSTLTTDWSVPIDLSEGELWAPYMQSDQSKFSLLGLSSRKSNSFRNLRYVRIDPSKHAVDLDTVVMGMDWDGSLRFRDRDRIPSGVVVSPDSSRFLYFRVDPLDSNYQRDLGTLVVHGWTFDQSGRRVDSMELRVPNPCRVPPLEPAKRRYHHATSVENGLLGAEIDNSGNVYLLARLGHDSLALVRHAASTAGTDKFYYATFPTRELPAGDSLIERAKISVREDGFVDVVASHVDHDEGNTLSDLLVASFDLGSGMVSSFTYVPNKDSLDALIDRKKLDGFVVKQIIYDHANKRTVVVLSYDVSGYYSADHGNVFIHWEHTGGFSPSGTYSPNNGPMRMTTTTSAPAQFSLEYTHQAVVFVFGADGKLVMGKAFPSRRNSAHSNFQLLRTGESALRAYYLDREADDPGLYRTDLDLTTATMTPPVLILGFSGGTYMLMSRTMWNDPHHALCMATGTMAFHGGERIAHPVLFELAVP